MFRNFLSFENILFLRAFFFASFFVSGRPAEENFVSEDNNVKIKREEMAPVPAGIRAAKEIAREALKGTGLVSNFYF